MSAKSLGKYIRQQREAMRLTRPAFEDRFQVGAGSLNNLEGGFAQPSTAMLKRLAEILGVRPGMLFDLLVDVISLEEALEIAPVREGAVFTHGEMILRLPEELRGEEEVIRRIEHFVAFEVDRCLKVNLGKNEEIHSRVQRRQAQQAAQKGQSDPQSGETEAVV
jgi:transcriptional regulator with XRE-family HTH domain